MNLLTVTISQMPARNLAIIHIHKCTPGIQRVENIPRFEPGSPDNVEKSMLPTRQGWLNDYLLPRYYPSATFIYFPLTYAKVRDAATH